MMIAVKHDGISGGQVMFDNSVLTCLVVASTLSLLAFAVPASAVTPESKAHTVKGIELVRQGKSKEAVEEFKKAIELDPPNADYHRNLSAVYQSLGMMPDAQKEAEAAVKYKGGDARNLEQLGNLLLVQKKYAEAEKNYRKAIKIAPKVAEYHSNLVICLKNQGKKAELEAELQNTLKKNPKDVDALMLQTKSFLDKKQTEDAEKSAREAVAAGAKNPDAHLALADVLKARGKDKEAVKEYEAALAIKPDHPSSKQIKDTINYIKNKVDSRIP
jgi:Tfp pilus assembly protein PilF